MNISFERLRAIMDLTNKPVQAWDSPEISSWLDFTGLPQHKTRFQAHHINGNVIFELDHTVLREMGMASVGDRARILIAVRHLQDPARYREYLLYQADLTSLPTASEKIYVKMTEMSDLLDVPPMSSPSPKQSPVMHNTGSSISSFQDSISDKLSYLPRLRGFTSTDKSAGQSPDKWHKRVRVKPTPIITTTKPPSAQASFITEVSENLSTPSPHSSTSKKSPIFTFFPFRNNSLKPRKIPVVRHPSETLPANSLSVVKEEESTPVNDVMMYDFIRRRCIRVLGDDSCCHVVNVNDLIDAASIRARIFEKFSITEPNCNTHSHALFVINEKNEMRCLDDEELFDICRSDPPKPEKDRLLLHRIQFGVEDSERIQKKYTKLAKIFGESVSDLHVAANEQALKLRPPSDVISLNWDLFFPGSSGAQSNVIQTRSRAATDVRRYQAAQYLARKQVQSIPIGVSGRRGSSFSASVRLSPTYSVHPLPRNTPPATPSHSPSSSLQNLPVVSNASPLVSASTIYTLPKLDQSPGEQQSADSSRTEDENIKLLGLRNWVKGDLIGKGSFANVYYGVSPMTGVIMAVKQVELPNPTNRHLNTADKRIRMRDALETEIQLLKSIDHPHIVRYLGSYSDASFVNVFLEYVSGGSISSILAREKWIPYPQVRDYVHQILHGLSFLHAQGIVHRDIKAGNILVTEDNRVKISDFGVSKLMSTLIGEHRFSMQGTVFWMAPELVKRTPYCEKVDIWSLGCLVLEMITGERPWTGYDQIQCMYQLGMNGTNPLKFFQSREYATEDTPIVSVASSIPAPAVLFLEKCFEVDANARLSAEELLKMRFPIRKRDALTSTII